MRVRVLREVGGCCRGGGSECCRVAAAVDLPPGKIIGANEYALGTNAVGDQLDNFFAVGRKCRHFQADLANGTIDSDGCLVCPWHGAKYDVSTGKMVRGPQKIFAKIPGVWPFYKALTAVLPLKRATVTEVDGDLFLT